MVVSLFTFTEDEEITAEFARTAVAARGGVAPDPAAAGEAVEN